MRKWQRVNHDIFHFSLSFFSSLIVRAFQPVAAKQPPKKKSDEMDYKKTRRTPRASSSVKAFFLVCSFFNSQQASERETNIREASNADELRCWVMKDNFVSSRTKHSVEKIGKNDKKQFEKENWKIFKQIRRTSFFLCFAREQRKDGIYFTLDKSHKLANWLFGIEFLSEQQYCMRADRNFLA